MKKIVLITLLGLLNFSCLPDIITINKAEEQTVFPGVKEAPILEKFTVKFTLSKPVQLETVHFKNKNMSFKLDKFLLKNYDTGHNYVLGKTLDPGSYIFETTMQKKDGLETDKDVLIFKIKTSQNKTYDYKVKLIKGKDIFMP